MSRGRPTGRSAFTLLELLVSVGIVATLAALSLAGFTQMHALAQGAYCANSLRQLGVATSLYLGDHRHVCFRYVQAAPGGNLWYFGFETSASLGEAEGQRTVDETQSPLYPYVRQAGGVEICPSFPYNRLSVWKPKYAGASWGYGFNLFLSGVNTLAITHPAQVLLFGDCAQVNTFQAPASPKNPLLEEFYMIDNTQKTIHFRHGSCANVLFLDGHVEKFQMFPGTQDVRIPGQAIGRITAVGSMQYLQ